MGFKYQKWLVGISCIIVPCLASTSSVNGLVLPTVRRVCQVGCAYRTIQAAINAALDGDTVMVYDGTYSERIDFRGKRITVRSANGPKTTVIDGNLIGSVVIFASGEGPGSVLRGFTITGGCAPRRSTEPYSNGGGIFCNFSSPTIANCIIQGNVANRGAGIYCRSASPTITDCGIIGNHATWYGSTPFGAYAGGVGGGIYCYQSSPSITNCGIRENYCDAPDMALEGGAGGGIYCLQSAPSIDNCVIIQNYMERIGSSGYELGTEGGGIFCYASLPSITNSTIYGNSAWIGGGISCRLSAPKITGCTIRLNSGFDRGGGISCLEASAPTISNCTITDNKSSEYGGGIYCAESSSPKISNCTISRNSASGSYINREGVVVEVGVGGGIFCSGSSPTITTCTIAQNSTFWGGGGIRVGGGSPTIANCTISGNTSRSDGGGIKFHDSSAVISDCTISGNSASYSYVNEEGVTVELGYGGGIYCGGTSAPNISNCTIKGNFANLDGGGIRCTTSSPIANCTISGNSAAGSGGGISCDLASPAISNCTISGNSAAVEGGGISAEAYGSSIPVPVVVNSILWGNYAPAGPEISPDGSITIRYSDVAGLGSGTGNIDRNPLFLNPRPYSEAPTTAGDYHIRAGSPCIDMGTGDTVTYPTIPAYDLDWDPRPQRGGYDMGSDERSLLRNGSFEKGSGQIPVPWGGKNLLFLSDGRDVSTAHSGRASFRISGNTAAKEVGQLLSLSGSAGDRLSVYCWHKAKEPSASGGLFGAVITVYHTDGSSNAYILGFPKRSHNWQKSQGTFTALKDYAKVKVSLVYANQKGFAWFDDVQLSVLK